MAAILTLSGRVALAKAVYDQTIHLALGSGAAAWDSNLPAPSTSATALTAEIGRLVITDKVFVVDDAAGEIVTSSGRYSLSPSNAPTRSLCLRARFGFADVARDVREVAVFTGTTLKTGLPVGQTWFLPTNLATTGTLLALDQHLKIPWLPDLQFSRDFVLNF